MNFRQVSYILTFTVFLISSCTRYQGRAGYNGLQNVSIQDSEAVKQKFLSYSIDEQINTYIFQRCCVEGSRYDLIRYLLVDAERKIPFLVQKLDVSEDPGDKFMLMGAINDLERLCQCNLLKPEHIAVLEKNRSKVRPDVVDYKYYFDNYLKQIKKRHSNKH